MTINLGKPISEEQMIEYVANHQDDPFAIRVLLMHYRNAIRYLAAREGADQSVKARVEQARRVILGRFVNEGVADSFDPRGYFVYLLWGDDEVTPIYVGQSRNVLSRVGTHMQARDRAHLVRRVQFIRCATNRAMLRLEMDLIKQYRPPLNVVGIPKSAPIKSEAIA